MGYVFSNARVSPRHIHLSSGEECVCTPCLRKLIFCFAFCHTIYIFLQPATDNPKSIKEHWTDQIYLLIWFLHIARFLLNPGRPGVQYMGTDVCNPQSDVILYSCKWHPLVTTFANLLAKFAIKEKTWERDSTVWVHCTSTGNVHQTLSFQHGWLCGGRDKYCRPAERNLQLGEIKLSWSNVKTVLIIC